MAPLLLSLDGFPEFWKSLEENHVKPLFTLADELEEEYAWVDRCVGRILTPRTAQAYYSFDNIDHKLQSIIAPIGFCLDFDWKEWEEEVNLYEDYSLEELKAFDPLVLCKIITVFIQRSREGSFAKVNRLLENKFFYYVLRAIQHQFQIKDISLKRS